MFSRLSSSLSFIFNSLSVFVETEPPPHTENGLPKDDSAKDPAHSARSIHSTSDYRAAKKERSFYPVHTHTPPPVRRVSSNPAELNPQRRVEGRLR